MTLLSLVYSALFWLLLVLLGASALYLGYQRGRTIVRAAMRSEPPLSVTRAEHERLLSEACLQAALAALTLLGVLYLAEGRLSLPASQRVHLQFASPSAPDGSHAVETVEVQMSDAAFGDGATCLDTRLPDRLDDKVEQSIATSLRAGRHVLAVAIGRHDLRELRPSTRRRYGSNLVLAQRRADCVAEVIRRMHPEASDRLLVVSLPSGSQRLVDVDTLTRTPGDSRDVAPEVHLAEDRRVSVLILSYRGDVATTQQQGSKP